MKIVRTAGILSIALALSVSSLNLSSASAESNLPPQELNTDTSARIPSILLISEPTVVNNDEPIITPFYIPIPYSYVYTKFISNYQLKSMLPKLSQNNKAITDVSTAIGLFSIPISVSRPIAIAGYLAGNLTSATYIKYKEAADKGLGVQVIVRNNPSYNGYNSRTLMEWIPTSTMMR